jgi:hypothetical protein
MQMIEQLKVFLNKQINMRERYTDLMAVKYNIYF